MKINRENSNKDIIIIELSKRKLVKSILAVLGVLLLIILCFVASDSKSEKYSNNTSNETSDKTSNDTSSSDELSEIENDSTSISEEERVSPTRISVSEYIDLYNGDDYSLVLLSKSTCNYCKIAVPILENIIYENNVDMKYVDVGELSEDELSTFIGSDDYFSEGYSTPTLLVIGKSEIKDKVEGVASKDNYISFMKEYGFIK